MRTRRGQTKIPRPDVPEYGRDQQREHNSKASAANLLGARYVDARRNVSAQNRGAVVVASKPTLVLTIMRRPFLEKRLGPLASGLGRDPHRSADRTASLVQWPLFWGRPPLPQSLDGELDVTICQFSPLLDFGQIRIGGKESKLPSRTPACLLLWKPEMYSTEFVVEMNDSTRQVMRICRHITPKLKIGKTVRRF